MKVTNISNLKKNLSACLKSVQSGEGYVVTDRDRPVALIEPLPSGAAPAGANALIADGILQPRRHVLDVNGLLSLPRGRCPGGLSAPIIEEREQR
jgi:antitoxin (DNA-binding transcriptional repressor) of toxin-antitoxin stability system